MERKEKEKVMNENKFVCFVFCGWVGGGEEVEVIMILGGWIFLLKW